MKQEIKQKFEKLLDKLFVKDITCIICGKEIVKDSRYSMCNKCKDNLPYIKCACTKCGADIPSGTLCLNCKRNLPIVEKNISVFNYVDPLTSLIYKLKYGNAKYLADYFGTFLVDKFVEQNIDVDILIPVPIHKIRLKERGYNQAELLSHKLNECLNIPIENDAVIRIVNTVNQARLEREKRLLNTKNVFKVVDKSKIKGKNILIVDDIYTTGATVNELAKVLYKSGANKIYSITLAHSKYKLTFEENNNDNISK